MIALLLAVALADTGGEPVDVPLPDLEPVQVEAPEPDVPVLEELERIQSLLEQVEADCAPAGATEPTVGGE